MDLDMDMAGEEVGAVAGAVAGEEVGVIPILSAERSHGCQEDGDGDIQVTVIPIILLDIFPILIPLEPMGILLLSLITSLMVLDMGYLILNRLHQGKRKQSRE